MKHQSRLTKIIEAAFRRVTRRDLIADLRAIGIACAPMKEMLDIVSDKRLAQRGATEVVRHQKLGRCVVPGRPVRFGVGTPPAYREAPTNEP